VPRRREGGRVRNQRSFNTVEVHPAFGCGRP
jgi:hypothetical protein